MTLFYRAIHGLLSAACFIQGALELIIEKVIFEPKPRHLVYAFAAAFLLTSNIANAGKLAEGFRGVQFGPASNISSAPLTDANSRCAHRPGEDQVEWMCATTFGSVPAIVYYMVEHDRFYGVLIHTESYVHGSNFRRILTSAYGSGSPSKSYDKSEMADWVWIDGMNMASFSYNQFSQKSQFIIFSTRVQKELEAIKAKKAAEASSAF